MKKTRSLQKTLSRTISIPTLALVLVLLSIILLGVSLIRNALLERQKLQVNAVAQQGDRYLAETGQLLRTLAYSMVNMPSHNQAELMAQIRQNYARFTALYLLDKTGKVLIEDTDSTTLLGLDMSREQFFRRAQETGQLYFSDPFISLATRRVAITGAVPIFTEHGFKGILVGELDLTLLQQTIEQVDVGEDSVSFIIDAQGTLVAHPNPSWVQERRNLGNLPLVQTDMAGGNDFAFFYDEEQHTWMISHMTSMTGGWTVITAQPVILVARPLIVLTGASGLALLLSLSLLSWAQTRSLRKITTPVALLTKKADVMSRGHYDNAVLSVEAVGDFSEIVSLNQSFGRMMEAVRERDRFLEQRVAERTQRLQIVATLSERLNTILDPDTLLTELIAQIHESLDYYFASVWLLNHEREELLLKEAHRPNNTDIIVSGESIRLDTGQSLVARAARTRDVINVADVHQSANWLSHPWVPDTCSELAIPIIVEDVVVGVLDIQEDHVAAFDANQVDMFRSLTNQLGVALHNARLYTEMEQLVAERTVELTATNETLANELEERKRTEDALRESETRFKSLYDSMIEGVCLHELVYNEAGDVIDYRIIDTNPSYETTLGLKRRDVINKLASEIYGTNPPPYLDIYVRVAQTGEPTQFETYFPPMDKHFMISAFSPREDQFATIFEDITARKRAAEALRHERDLLDLITETSPVGIVVADHNGQVTFANPWAEAILGLTKDQITQRAYNTPSWRITDYDGHPFPNAELPFSQIMATGQSVYDVRHAIEKSNGDKVLLSINAAPLFDEAGQLNGMVATVDDITAQVQAETQLKQALADKTALVQELYHRTKNNMQVIAGMLALHAAHQNDARLSQIFKAMDNRIHAMSLAHQALYQAKHLSRLDLRQYILDLSHMLLQNYYAYARGISLTTEMDEVHTLIDTAIPCGLVLNEILTNILTHAFPKNTGGQVHIRLQRTEHGEIVLSITDNGVGVPKDFDFRQCNTVGLPTAIGIVEHQLRGEIIFEAQDGVTCHIRFIDNLYEERV